MVIRRRTAQSRRLARRERAAAVGARRPVIHTVVVPQPQAATADDAEHRVLLLRLRAVFARGRPLEGRDVDGLGPLVAGLGVVADARALGKRLEARGVDAGVVDEQVLA